MARSSSPPLPHSQPPRLAEWLLALMLDERDREYILGDLAGEYRSLYQAEGARTARFRHWRHLLLSIRPSARTRLGAWRRRRRAASAQRPRSKHALGEAMNTLRADLRFVLSLRLSIPSADYPENADISGFYIGLLDRVRGLPGVREAGAARVLPLAQSIGDWSITIEGREENPGEDFDGDWQFVTPGYFETMRIPLQEGRFFDSRDRTDGRQVMIVNQAMASLYWPGESAIGKRIRFCGSCTTRPWVEIVGIVGDIRHNGISGQINSKWYAAHAQVGASLGFTSSAMTLVIRTDGDPLSIVSAVRREVRTQDANVPVAAVQTIEDVLGASVAEPRFTMTLLLVFGAVALLLAAVGVYGVISYTISERTHEWGLRRALGATAGDVVGMVVRQGMAVAGAGVIAGLVGAYWLTSLMSSLLYETGARDPVTFLAVPVILALVALVATLLPARRAVAVEPSTALREG